MNNRHKACRVCGSDELETITKLPDYPLSAGPTTRTTKTIPTCDLEIGLCHHCGTCILLNTDTDNLAYGEDYTSSNIVYGQVKSMDEKTNRFADFVGKAQKPIHSKVLEIGCYDGTFMGILQKKYEFDMIGCEPCTAIAEEARSKGCNVIPKEFDVADYGKLDMVVARNILEHISSPSQFVKDTASVLKENGAVVLEVPAGEYFVENGILGTIVPEHPCYFGEESLERLLLNSFEIAVAEASGAAIRTLALLPRSRSRDDSVFMIVANAARLRSGEQKRQERYDAIGKAIGGKKVDIFGANTCTLELIAVGAIRTEQVSKVYDDDPRRWGRYLINTDLTVYPRDALVGRRRKVLVCSYSHRQPIADYITSTGNIPIKLYGDDE